MNDTIIVGLDLGYGFSKAVSETGRQVVFPSLVAPAEAIRFQSDVGKTTAGGITLHNTCEGDLFVGELARRQGRPGAVRSPRDRDRVADPIVTHLADAAFSALLPNVDYACLQVVTGLPVDYYPDAEALIYHLKGAHAIDTGERQLLVDVAEVRVVPQPFGALLTVLLDETVQLMPDVSHLVQGRVGVLDIGSYTTDLILVDELEYIESGSGSLEVGVSTVLGAPRSAYL